MVVNEQNWNYGTEIACISRREMKVAMNSLREMVVAMKRNLRSTLLAVAVATGLMVAPGTA